MDPITLHFNIFQAGSGDGEGRQSLQVDDPRSTTVLALKHHLFPDAMEARRSVRFIASGRILQDAALLEKCGLGRESHIHVSISDQTRATGSQQTPPMSPEFRATTSPAGACDTQASDSASEELWPYVGRFLGLALLAIGGLLFHVAWQKRRQLSMHTSQMACIAAAVWVYALLCHGLPAFIQVVALLLRCSMFLESKGRAGSAETRCPSPSASQTDSVAVDASSTRVASVTTMRPLSEALESTARARSLSGTENVSAAAGGGSSI